MMQGLGAVTGSAMAFVPFETLLAFAATCLVIELTPGPNMAYLAVLSATTGRRAGAAATLGVALGLLTVGIAAALGLTAVIASSRMLYETLQYDLQVVSIELEGRDDPQVIFETLNARGEPLLPSDLLRNYLFWRANRQKAQLDELYKKHWASFDSEFWKQEEKQGRLKRPRVDLFFANLLQMKTAAEVNMGRLFHEYKEWSEKIAKYPTVREELVDISTHAAIFYALEPVIAAVFAYLYLSETLGWRRGAGAALIITGLMISRLRLATRLTKKEAIELRSEVQPAEADL